MNILQSAGSGFKCFLLMGVLFLVGVGGCSDDDPTGPGPGPGADITGVVRTPEGRPATAARVYLGMDPVFPPATAPFVIDSVQVDDSGAYTFDELAEGSYRTYAGVWNSGGDDFSQVSAFSDPLAVAGKSAGQFVSLTLQELEYDGVVAGEAVYEDESDFAPADSADVFLYRYLGRDRVKAYEGKTDLKGKYALPGIGTGNYTLTVVKEFSLDGPYPLYLSAESEVFFCAGDDLVKMEQLILQDTMVEKPAVYIYPDEAGRFDVGLGFGPGVRLTASEPEYGNGWSVFVDGSGRIDGTWDYLFYEIAMRGAPRIEEGWCFSWSELTTGLAGITSELGLNAAEQEDFLTYWTERLPRRDFYEIHPVTGADLDSWVQLQVDPAPATVLRFWLFFEGRDTRADFAAPEYSPPTRSGTTVVEWGGAVLP